MNVNLDKAWEIIIEMGVIVRNRLEAEEYLQKLVRRFEMIKYRCDRCNKEFNIEDRTNFNYDIFDNENNYTLDLCNECANELVEWFKSKIEIDDNEQCDNKDSSECFNENYNIGYNEGYTEG